MPTQKRKSKTRVGSKEIKVYDEPSCPFQRLMEHGALRPRLCQNSENRDDATVYSGVEPYKKANNTIYTRDNGFLHSLALYNPVELQ
jgi:hypothetical protein